MATTELTHFAPHPGPGLKRLAAGAVGFVAGLAKAVRGRRAVTRLLDLDDRMLRDIGITRGDVHAALAQRFDEDPAYSLTIFSAAHSAHRRCNGVRRDI